MKPLSISRLREMAATRELALDEEELRRLLPMVRDLFEAARRLRIALPERTIKQPG